MRPDATVRELLAVIRSLPPDPPRERPGKWYRTQQEHWIRWLSDYDGPGAYGRTNPSPRDARTVYNRVVEPGMLLYLASAAGVDGELVQTAEREAAVANSLMQASGRVRRLIPWELLAAHLPEPSLWRRLRARSRV